jgi:hypothetical protein
MAGNANSGRRRGDANRAKKQFRDLLRQYCVEKGVNPFYFMADLLAKKRLSLSVKLLAAKELAQYLEPKLRSTELTGDPEKPVALQNMTTAQIDARLATLVTKWQALMPTNGHQVEMDHVHDQS